MTLAETASIFGETIVGNYLVKAKSLQDKLSVAWENAGSASAFLINIPARFSLKNLFTKKDKKGEISPDRIEELNKNALEELYGDSLSEVDRTFTTDLKKLHSYLS